MSRENKSTQEQFGSDHPDRLVNEKEAAGLLGMSVRTLQNWRVRGGGPKFAKLNGAVRYRVRHLNELIDQNTVSNTSELGARA